MFRSAALIAFTFAAVVLGQQVGTLTAETHPTLQVSQCTAAGQCTTQSKSVVLDSNWRWLHTTSGSTNCYDGNTWDSTLCSSPTTCASNCALDGADYSGTYGITTSGNALTLKFVTTGQYSTNIGSRVYLMDDETHYKMFNLKNQEFTFDVDMSQLPCGLNGALYFSEMEADGGMSKNTGNKAGAKYGTGYCDSQCPHDIKFINGEANVLDWAGSPNDANAGTGRYGACCSEMDIWEANSMASAYTPHPCSVTGIRRCSGTECGDGDNRYGGVCDKDGCDFNSFRMGDKNFLGKGKTIDTTKKITVVTQFITDNGSATGKLSEIRRIYVQNGVVYQNSKTNIASLTDGNSITDTWCAAQKTAFGDTNSFASKGGLAKMGDAFANGMVLVMSVWDDHAANMLWLDSNYPTTKSASTPGVARGECATTSGVPADVESQSPNAQVTFSNIRTGPIGSTYTGSTGTPSGPTSQPGTGTSTSAGPGTTATAPKYAQCGGIGYTGPTVCASGSTCTKLNDYYFQCL
ncbi:hypothetical protein CCMSSC00406_0000989 [Pleurotus cornucopiae]|uniref:Uncharacterized protein n=1 Tax=Pleurotus cornucopiae TaxID=5321 RepID=A0ACB7IKZ6_PLECO|nr:hypothetical protein CCMSSC00406_0000989 [Pleurotus cornucopiae]